MYDGGKIITGLVIGLGLLLFPFFYDAGKASKAPDPELTPKAKEAKACVAAKDYMTTQHMHLLDAWRNEAVRDADRYYKARRRKGLLQEPSGHLHGLPFQQGQVLRSVPQLHGRCPVLLGMPHPAQGE